MIYVNGQLVAKHTGGFTSFDVEIGPWLREADNVLVVRVNNQRHAEAVPPLNTDWWNYGGLTRDVRWVETPPVFIADYCVSLEDARTKDIKAWVKLSPPMPGVLVTISIPELGVAATAVADGLGLAKFALQASVELWSPDSPRLYSVEVSTEADAIFDRIGFRTIAVSGRDICSTVTPYFCEVSVFMSRRHCAKGEPPPRLMR